MVLLDYFDSVKEGINFLLALGSIIGLLGLLTSCCLIYSSKKKINSGYTGLLIVSIILIIICGLYTGIKYFRI